MEANPNEPSKSARERCPHCQAPVVGWKRRWFAVNAYKCGNCGGESRVAYRSVALTFGIVLVVTGIVNVAMHHLKLENGPRFMVFLALFAGFLFWKKNRPLRKIIVADSVATIPDECPHCQAPVVGWKRRWFRDNTYHCEACGGNSVPSFFHQHAPMDGFVLYFVWAVLNGEMKSAFSLTLRLTVALPLLIAAFVAIRSRQSLGKIPRNTPEPPPDPNPCECGSCGITLKRGRRDCHWCGWKPAGGVIEN